MSSASYAARGRGGPATGDAAGRSPWAWVMATVAVVVLCFLVAWLLGWIRFTTDPRVKEVLALQAEAQQKFSANGGPQTLAEATEAFAAMGRVREKMEALPEHLRMQVMQDRGSMFRSGVRQRIDAYFEAAPADRKAVLDKQIDQEELFRKAMAAAGGFRGGPPGGGPPGGGPGAGGPPVGGPGGGPPGAGRGGPPAGGGDEGRNRWMKGIIDSTSPEQRARFTEHRRAIDERRRERGLEPGWPR